MGLFFTSAIPRQDAKRPNAQPQVARDKVTKKSMAVAPLAPETAAQRAQQQAGAARQEARVAAGKADQTPASNGSNR